MFNVAKKKKTFGNCQSALSSRMNKPRKWLPDNLVCQDLLADPSYLEHPRTDGTLIIQCICPWENETTMSVFGCITTGPMVPLAPFVPMNPTSPWSPTGPVSPKWPRWPLLPWRIAKHLQHGQGYCLANPTFDTGELSEEDCRACRAPSCLLLTC